MKKAILFFFVISLTSLLSLSAQAPEIPQATAKDNVFKITVGFHCANGKKLLETKLMEIKGVTAVVADLETKIVTIEHNSEIASTKSLVEAIETIGYSTEFSNPNKPIKKACNHH